MHAHTEGETGADSKRHQQLSADIELQRMLAAYRDSPREACSCIERETERDMQKQIDRETDS